MDADSLLSLLGGVIQRGRAETIKTSLNRRKFMGFYHDVDGAACRLEVDYTVYPQYIEVAKAVLYRGFDARNLNADGALLAKDSFVGEYFIR